MSAPFHIPGLIAGGWKDLSFTPFREGIEISSLFTGSPALAVLRYEPGAAVPYHSHPGPETILVLEGSQSDERGTYPVGTLVVNPKDSAHSVWSERGCTVLIHWAEPVVFIEAQDL